MTQPQLDNLVRIGRLKTEPAAREEIQGLVRSGTRRLVDAAHEGLSLESRFDLAHNAGHALALAALRFRGYRSESRYLVFQCLQHTIDLPPLSGEGGEIVLNADGRCHEPRSDLPNGFAEEPGHQVKVTG